jgi:hypothetical protein
MNEFLLEDFDKAISSGTNTKEKKYLRFYKRNCSFINFETFGNVKEKLLKYIQRPKFPDVIKIMVGSWFFDKIYMNYKCKEEEKDIFFNVLTDAIYNVNNLVPKCKYIRYRDVDFLSRLCLYFFHERFEDHFFILQLLNDTQLIKNYLNDSELTPMQLLGHFLTWINDTENYEQKSNILDVILKYYPKNKHVLKVYDEMRFERNANKSIYGDAQNVHDDEISKNTMEIAEKFVQWGRKHPLVPINPDGSSERTTPTKKAQGFLHHFFETKEDQQTIDAVLTRITIDNTQFGSFQIRDVFFALVSYIKEITNKDYGIYDPETKTFEHQAQKDIDGSLQKAIVNVFMEEMEQMKELCASGYISRCISVLQGFDKDYSLTISFEKKLHGVLSYKISKEMNELPEGEYTNNIVSGTFDKEFEENYFNFIVKSINRHIDQIIKDNSLKEVDDSIVNVVKQITNTKERNIWSFKDGKLSFIYDIEYNDEDEEDNEENVVTIIKDYDEEEEDNNITISSLEPYDEEDEDNDNITIIKEE